MKLEHDPLTYLNAFKRNCPHVRMLPDEEHELLRLINLAMQQAEKRALTGA